MGNKKDKPLPHLPPDIQANLEALSKDVKGIWASLDFGTTKKAIRIGHKLLLGEEAVNAIFGQKRNVWGQFRAHYFPEIETARMAERYMLLARHIDLDAPPILFCLSQASLTDLISLAGRQSLREFIVNRKISIDWEIEPRKKENKAEVARFKQAVLDLTSGVKAEMRKAVSERDHGKEDGTKDSKPPESAKRLNLRESIDNLEESFSQLQQWITSITGCEDFKGRKRRLLRVKLIKYRRILNLFIESISENNEGSVELLPSRARKKRGGIVVLKKASVRAS